MCPCFTPKYLVVMTLITIPFYCREFLDVDGLPYPGTRLTDGDPFYCYRNDAEGTFVVKKFEGKETYFVDSVKLCGNDTGSGAKNRACISLRVPRNPSVGDKFASRYLNKAVLLASIYLGLLVEVKKQREGAVLANMGEFHHNYAACLHL